MTDQPEVFMTSKFTGLLKWSGGRQLLKKGQTFQDDHPIVLERPELFERAVPTVDVRTPEPLLHGGEPPIERGTRAPGERRESVDGRRRGRTA
jgi:hypothetical protein